jgi:pyrimidine operon attenuation protein/uracil phosphoribosyltransferase
MASSNEPARSSSPGGASTGAPGTLLSAADVARVVDRMAHQLIERAAAIDHASADGGLSALVLVGIPTRGAPLARRLAARIEAFSGTAVDVGTVDITLYRDDLRLRGVRALEPTVLPDAGIDDRLVVLVDDVLFSGRSVRAALDALRDLGHAACSWRCWSTAATASCRSGRTSSARTCRPHAPSRSGCIWQRRTAWTRSC